MTYTKLQSCWSSQLFLMARRTVWIFTQCYTMSHWVWHFLIQVVQFIHRKQFDKHFRDFFASLCIHFDYRFCRKGNWGS